MQLSIFKFYFDLKVEGDIFVAQTTCATVRSLKGSIPSQVINN
jgi:hypothetical protein